MSQHMAAKYRRDYRKRASEQQAGNTPKQPRTVAERVRMCRATKKAAKGNASPIADWDAGEGPSTRVFPPARSIVEQVNVVQGIIDEPDDDCEVNNGPTSAGEIEAVADRASPTHTMASDVSFPEHSSQDSTSPPNFDRANREFVKRFMDNAFGAVCDVCDRLWFVNDLKPLTEVGAAVLVDSGSFQSVDGFSACQTCRANLKEGKVPALSKSNGFVYPDKPSGLPPLDVVTERLVSPRLPFMQIRRLRFAAGSFSIIGQVINCPVDVAQMLHALPRQLDDDQAFNVFIKKHVIHKSSYLSGFVKKANVKAWLSYLITTPLYRRYGITIDQIAMDGLEIPAMDPQIELETIALDNETELLLGQQETLLWNEDQCLEIAPAQNRVPLSLIYDEHGEELAFPAIYYGHPRQFKQGVRVTYFMIASSETRRQDRRGAKPQHLLYMAMKVLRLRVSEGLQCTFKCTGTANITRANLKDREFMEQCIERNLSFLKSIPNSVQYWQQRKRDLFAMMRQLGKPTMFLTLSANEMKWPHLLKILHRLSEGYNGSDLRDPMQELTALQRATLVNEDPVTCCVYFNKLVDTIMFLLMSQQYSPFGKYRVVDYFKRIEFQHRGSPHAHILLWLDKDPREVISESMPRTVQLIEDLCSVGVRDLPSSYGYQVHKHTFTCFKRNENHCRFNIPYWPMDRTLVLLPLASDDSRRDRLTRKAKKMRDALEAKSYDTLEAFLSDCNCTYDCYLDVIRVSIRRPTVLFKRSMSELWTNPFNPWIANHLGSNMDLQFILDEYSCAAYVVEYVNKTNRGVSCLQRDLIKLQEEFPDQDFTALLKKVSIKMLNSVEMSAQEAAWYLLRQPMSEASRATQFIPTMWPHERTRSKKRNQRMDEEGITEDSTDVWTMNIVQKYEARDDLDDVCLADFAAFYTKQRNSNSYKARAVPRVLQWCGYDMSKLADYKREMVLLFVPFRNELCDILDQNKFLHLYDQHEQTILAKRKEYDCNMNMEQIIEEYMRVSDGETPDMQEAVATEKRDEFSRAIVMQPNDDDIRLLPTNALSAVIKQRTTVMSKQDYCALVRKTNAEQRALILQVIDNLHCFDDSRKPLQLFFTGPAGCGKTFTLHILMETYNRFSQQHNSRNNAYVACASTGKAAVAIGGTTVHSAFHITMDRRHHGQLRFELLQLYRQSFANIKLIIIDEVSMIGANIFNTVHTRLQNITGDHDLPFGGKDVIMCGDFRQLPPVNARPAYKSANNAIGGAALWQTLDYFPLRQVMRQTDVEFSSILTKIGNGERLTDDETKLVESRFRTVEWCKENVPNAIRLYHRNSAVDMYNNDTLNNREGCDCIAEDVITGYQETAQLTSARTKLHKMSVAETGCLPYLLRLVIGMSYMITTNVEVGDGLVNGAIGELKYIEHTDDDPQQPPYRLWFKFENNTVGAQLRVKSRPVVFSKPGILQQDWTPIYKRSVNVKLSSAIKCKRIQFPVASACALTIHKSQGGTFPEIVVDYDKTQEQQLVYVAISRVSSIDGLYLTNTSNCFIFHHGKGSNTPKMKELRDEIKRLENHRLMTLSDEMIAFLENGGNNSTVLMSLNVQSLNAHSEDISTDRVMTRADILALSETWMDSNVTTQLEGYRCISKFKRENARAGGVAIFEKASVSVASTPHTIEKLSEQHDPILKEAENYGDICAADIVVDGCSMVLFCIYLCPSTTVKYGKAFIARHLYHYVSRDVPVIVTGDFNIDVSKQENSGFVEFMTLLGFKLSSDPKLPTTLGGSCIDMVFTRKTPELPTKRYITYFSYHRPLFSLLPAIR